MSHPIVQFRVTIFTAFLLLACASFANGQTNSPAVGMKPAHTSAIEDDPILQGGVVATQAPAAKSATPCSVWGPETVLALALMVFFFFILVGQFYLVMKDTVDWTPNTIIRFFGLTLIINGGVLLVVAGFSSQQIAGVLALLGSIAGYLLGSSSKGSTDGDSRKAANSSAPSAPIDSNEN